MTDQARGGGGFKFVDFFSGIGAFTLGLQRAGMTPIAFSEIDPWAVRVLKKHWPSVPNLGDITKIGIPPMSYAAGSPAKILASRAKAPALPAPVPVSGGGFAVPFAWYDHGTRSWRTWQRSLNEGEEWVEFSGTWPRSGMTRNGIAYQLPTLAHPMTGTVPGLLPTPSGVNGGKNHTVGRLDEWGGSSNPFRGTELGKVRCASFEEWMMGLPTGHTALTPSEIPSPRKSRKVLHGQSSKEMGATHERV